MRITKIGLSITFMLGLTASSAWALTPVPASGLGVTSQPITLVDFSAKGKKVVKIRSIGFLQSKLVERGFTVVDGRRHGQLYFFRLDKDGYDVIMTVDGRSANIVGLEIVSVPAGVTLKPRGSAGNHYVDWTYEYGYSVDVATYETYHSYTEAEISSTEVYAEVYLTEEEITIETSEVASYEVSMTTEESVVADLDEGDPSDAAGDAIVTEDVGSYPDETDQQAANEPADGTEEQ